MWKQVIFFLIFCLFSTAYAAEDLQPLAPEQAFVFSAVVDQNQALVLQWKIAPGYFLYKDKIKVSAAPNDQVKIGTVILPAGDLRKDDLHGSFEAYRDLLRLVVPTGMAPSGRLALEIKYQGCSLDGFCYTPVTKILDIDATQLAAAGDITSSIVEADAHAVPLSDQDFATQLLAGKHLLFIAIGFFVLGLLLAFTPCVLPMVPILSGIIIGYGRDISTKKAFSLSLTYVLGMALAYASAGMLVALAGSRIQIFLQQSWVIVLFSGLFVLLALSLFDFYELKLSSTWHQRIHNWSHRHEGGTYVGVFAMGVLSTLIVSPCVSAPLVGVLAYIGNSGDVVLGGLALLALGLGMGVPLLLVGTSVGKLLPKSGAWMMRVKQLFGFFMLALAIWMLERILPGAVILFLWAMLAFIIAVFIWQLKHNEQIWRKLHQGFGLMILSYAFILFGGAVAGQVDPLYLLNYSLGRMAAVEKPKFILVKDMVQLNALLATAKQERKPVLLDFYADWCASCVVMDRHVFAQAAVSAVLKNFVLLRADVTKNNAFDKALLQQFHVIAPPTMLFFNVNGEEIRQSQIVGEVSAKVFLTHIQQLHTDQVRYCQANAIPC